VVVSSAPGLLEVLQAWRLAPVVEVGVVVAALGYAVAAGRAGRWPWPRALAWVAALVVAVVALDGPVAVYGDVLFWVHMIGHLSLIMVVPVLVVWARPLELLRGAGFRSPERMDRLLRSRPVRVLSFPPLTLAAYAAVVVLTHLTGFQQVAVEHPALRGGETALYLVSGYLLFLPLVGDDAGPRRLPHLLRLVVLILAMGVDTLTGVVLMLTRVVLAPAYSAAHPGWGPSALADQNVAGAVMWWGGDGVMMLLLVVVAIRWGTAPEAEQGLGSWVEGARRAAVLGTGPSETGVDDNEAALAAYNARLAALHGHPSARPERQR
jgi:putative copper resistance protein D